MRKQKHFSFVIGQCVKENIVPVLLLGGTIVGSIIAGLLPPLLLGKAVDGLLEGKAVSFSMAFGYLGVYALYGILEAAKNGWIAVCGQKVTHAFRSAMAEKMNRLSASYYVSQESGRMVSMLVQDVDTIEVLFNDGIISMFADACSLLSLLGVVFTRSLGLGLLILLVLPLLFALTRHFQKRMLEANMEERAAVAESSARIPEALRNMRTIQSLRLEAYIASVYDRSVLRGFRAREKANRYDAVYSPIIVMASVLLIGGMMLLQAKGGVWQRLFGMSVGTTVATISYVGKIFDPLENIGMEIQNIQSAAAGLSRIQTFLETEEEADLPEETVDCNTSLVIEAKQLGFWYEKDNLLFEDFNLQVKQGEMVTVAGRTGAGKSTLFRLLLGLYHPLKGSVSVFGKDPFVIAKAQRRKVFGYVEQSFHQVDGTIKDQVTLMDPKITDGQVIEALRKTSLYETVESLPQGLDTPYTEGIFSQGQAQLLAIARAIVCDPSLLLFDEISANLDTITEEKVLKTLMDIGADRTILSISHRLYESTGGKLLEIGK